MKWNLWLSRLTRPFAKRDDREEGMTIIEILIVIALIGTLMTVLMNSILKKNEDAKVDLAKVGMSQLSNGLSLYKMHNNRFPTTEEGLGALLTAPSGAKNWRGPYTEEDKLKDPWDTELSYESTGVKSFKITSAGPDQTPGTEDDISYPESKDGAGGTPAE
jgi:general secretion pathway protein G